MRFLRNGLNELGVGLAYDDFGAGQARLVELTEVPPDYVKFDKELVQDVHKSSAKHLNIVRMLVSFASNEGIHAIAEGIENSGIGPMVASTVFVAVFKTETELPAPPWLET